MSAEDETWHNTPLGWAVHGWQHPPPGSVLGHYTDIAARLVAEGAKVRPEWLDDPKIRRDARFIAALRGLPVPPC